jgi:cation-transporting ATPase 13A2
VKADKHNQHPSGGPSGTCFEPVPPKFIWVKINRFKQVLFYVSCIVTGGVVPIVCTNYPHLKLVWITDRCDAEHATLIRCDDSQLGTSFTEVEKHSIAEGEFRCFEKFGIRYLAQKASAWTIVEVPHVPDRFTEIFVRGLDEAHKPSPTYLKSVYGLNRMKIEAADALSILVREMVSPFYLFQYGAIAVWLYTLYYVYSGIIIIITGMSIILTVHVKVHNLRRLHELAGRTQLITPYDLKENKRLPDRLDPDLVPGDCFVVTPGTSLCCDAILVSGRVIIDESMLTGESVPVTKTAYVYSTIDSNATKRSSNTLFSGTFVKSVHEGQEAIAMVYRTGFRSQRGELINELVAPRVEIVQFMPDAMNAILFMVIITTCIFGWSASQLQKLDVSAHDIGISYLTALTIAVPPGLVACLSIGSALSVGRLASKNIKVADTGKLSAAGYCTYACFDKTGTLTDERICYEGTKHYNADKGDVAHVSHQLMGTCHSLSIVDNRPQGDALEVELLRASGWRYSLEGKHAYGTPPEGQKDAGKQHTILKLFEFSPEKLRAGVLLQNPDESRVFLMKGSPEMVTSFCVPSTVPPTWGQDLMHLSRQGFRVLAIAWRSVAADDTDTAQEHLEKNMIFLGLVYFSNNLKKDTHPATVGALKDAKIHVAMITGDYFSTALAISAKCLVVDPEKPLLLIDAFIPDGSNDDSKSEICIKNPATDEIIPHLTIEFLEEKYYPLLRINDTSVNYRNGAFETTSWANHWKRVFRKREKPAVVGDLETGSGKNRDRDMQILMTGDGYKVLREKYPDDVYEAIVRMTSVFARMKPADKKTIVECLMRPDVRTDEPTTPCKVLFCGDGANDMEALSASTVGVSLCDTATTIAAAIVSTDQSPISTIDVLKEGRCSLVTAYILVNFNIMYAIIQLFMTCYLNNLGLVFGDYIYLIQDFFFSLLLGLAIADVPPTEILSVKRPPQTLFDRGLLMKLAFQLPLFPIFQLIVLEALHTQSWYVTFSTDTPLEVAFAHESAALNIMALGQVPPSPLLPCLLRSFFFVWTFVSLSSS